MLELRFIKILSFSITIVVILIILKPFSLAAAPDDQTNEPSKNQAQPEISIDVNNSYVPDQHVVFDDNAIDELVKDPNLSYNYNLTDLNKNLLASSDGPIGKSILSSLLKIIHQLKHQLDGQNGLKNRLDEKDLPSDAQIAPKEASIEGNKIDDVRNSSSLEFNLPADSPETLTTVEVSSEPLTGKSAEFHYNQPLVTRNGFRRNSYQPNSNSDNNQPDESKKSPTTGKFYNPPIVIDQLQDSWNPMLTPVEASSVKHDRVLSSPENLDSTSRPLFTMTTSSSKSSSKQQNVQDSFSPDTNFNERPIIKESIWITDTTKQSEEPVLTTKRIRSRSNMKSRPTSKHQRNVKVGEHYNRYTHSDVNQPQQLDDQEPIRQMKFNYYADSSQESSPRTIPLNHNGIQLNQVYPPQAQQQSMPQVQQQLVYTLASAPGGLKGYMASAAQAQAQAQVQAQSQPQVASGSGYDPVAGASNSNMQQRDLLNQPQTIQITAVPNVGFPNNQLVNNQLLRVNNALGVNTLLNNGLNGFGGINGFLDPLGRQVFMVNAERRQIDWSFWIWPLIAVVTLPLILGALFVPVFLKTVVVLIQILQSLGLLLPITSALGQQIAQASLGIPPTNSSMESSLNKTA